jgi:peptidoglycan/LPS O-acetylase OafA/YrhL
VPSESVDRPPAGRLPHWPALDGIRALAIAGVLVYHAAPAVLPGGFLGVEVFFVLSGYLITAMLLAEWRRSAHVDLGRFWYRRARRLLPALFCLLLATVAATAAWQPDQLASLRGDLLPAIAYVANWHQVFEQRPYFETIGQPPLLQHLWSLAVEEQFYLVWPIVLMVALRFVPRAWLVVGLGIAAVASAIWMAYVAQAVGDDPLRAYYGTDTRASGLLMGAALAVALSVDAGLRVPGRVLQVVGIVAVGALVCAGALLTESAGLLYRGGFLVVDVASVCLIVAMIHPQAGWQARALGSPPLRWLGERSYSAYLWHWPVLVLFATLLPLDGWPGAVAALLAIGVLAEASFRWVERPLRGGALERLWQDLQGGAVYPPLGRRVAIRSALLVVGLLGYVGVVGPALASARVPERPSYLAVDAVDTWQSDTQVVPTLRIADAASPTPLPVPTPTSVVPQILASPVSPAPDEDASTSGSTVASAPDGQVDALSAASPVDAGPVDATDASSVPAPMVAPTGLVAAVGDSVMLGAVPVLQRTFDQIEIDAVVGRQVAAGLNVLQARKAAGELPDSVVVQLGNNGTFTDIQATALLDALSGVRHVVLVNLRVPRPWEGPNNAVIAAAVQRSSNAVLVDWHAEAVAHPELLYDDHMHLRPQGAEQFAAMIAAALSQTGS